MLGTSSRGGLHREQAVAIAKGSYADLTPTAPLRVGPYPRTAVDRVPRDTTAATTPLRSERLERTVRGNTMHAEIPALRAFAEARTTVCPPETAGDVLPSAASPNPLATPRCARFAGRALRSTGAHNRPALASDGGQMLGETLGALREPGHYLEVEPGVEVYYEDHGDGPPIVFVPGWTFSTEVFDRQVEHLAGRHRVIVVDQRSHGRSPVAGHGNNYGTLGADLVKLVEALELDQVVFVGWSFGALTNWSYLRHAGLDRVRAMVSVDLSPKPLSVVDTDWAEGPLDEIAGAYNEFLTTPAGHRAFVTYYAEEVMVQRDLEPAELAWLVDQSLRTPTPVAAQLFASGMFSDYRAEATKVDAERPTLHFVAEHWAPTATAFLATHCPRGEVRVLGGHLMFWEHAERFNEMLDEFVAALPPNA